MSDLTRQSISRPATPSSQTRIGGEFVRLPGDCASLTGTPGQVGQMLAHIQSTGRLVSSSLPVPTGVPGQVLINVRLIPRQRTQARPAPVRRGLPRWAICSIVGTALALAAGLAWAIYQAVTAVAAHAADIGGVLLLALLVLAGFSVAGGRAFS